MGDWHGTIWVVAGLVVAWGVWIPLSARLERNPKGSLRAGLAFALNWVYVRLWHRLHVEGWEHIPPPRARTEDGELQGDHPPLLVVANHTAGVDPLLVQYACPFFIRWMMAAEMRIPELDWLWTWLEIIFVRTEGPRSGSTELAALKDTIRYLKAGGVIGIFPEGRLERPAGVLHPFQPGAGMLISRTGAKVLPVVIKDTPFANSAWGTLWRTSRAKIRFMPPIDYQGVKAGAIMEDLQKRFVGWTGWQVLEPPPDPPRPA